MRDLVTIGLFLVACSSGLAFAEESPSVATPPIYVQHVESGTIKAECSPWNGSSFIIDLPTTHSVVYASLDKIEEDGGAVVLEADPKAQKEGFAQITKCSKNGSNCRLKDGIVAITTIEKDTIIGVVQISMAGWGRSYNGNESHMFRAKYDRTKPVCK